MLSVVLEDAIGGFSINGGEDSVCFAKLDVHLSEALQYRIISLLAPELFGEVSDD